ncbi:MAG: hypothetical protein KDK53_13725 [Maritimibacter sp.]|nr:hypothetical protein [Maritimibacter sp.]
MSTKIVLVGAGSAMFGLGAVGDILKSAPLAGCTVTLNDINPKALDFVAKTARSYVEEHGLPYTIEATTDLDAALAGADYCIISIEVGDRHELWDQDWRIPLQYGIRQVYGENGGPGGLFHALRITPPILDIVEKVTRICPDATVINLSNPMVRISQAITTKFPGVKYVGLCHEVYSLIEHLPQLLGTPFENLSIKAGGLNHFSVLLEASYKDSGKDAYPDIRDKAPAYFAEAPAVFGNIGERKLFLEILKRFGHLPITTDSHFGEYIHWASSAADHDGILEFYWRYKKSTLGNLDKAPELIATGTPAAEYWRVIPIIEGILTDSGQSELAVNVVNDGLIDLLPSNAVVEVPATIDRNGVHGVRIDNYPKGFGALLQNQVGVNNLTVEAILTGSKEVAMQALLTDPVVDSLHAAEGVMETILRVQSKYLGYLK